MKKLLLSLCLMSGMTIGLISCDTNTKDISVLPLEAQSIIKDEFKSEVKNIEIEKKKGVVKDYEVKLQNGVKIEFDSEGKWTQIKAPLDSAVPNTFIPDTVLNYINSNYTDVKVQKIEKEIYGYELDLSNNMELKFDKNGGIIKVD